MTEVTEVPCARFRAEKSDAQCEVWDNCLDSTAGGKFASCEYGVLQKGKGVILGTLLSVSPTWEECYNLICSAHPQLSIVSSLETADRLGRIQKRSTGKCCVWHKTAGIDF